MKRTNSESYRVARKIEVQLPDPSYRAISITDISRIKEDLDGLSEDSAAWQNLASALGTTAASALIAAISVNSDAWVTSTELAIIAAFLTAMTMLCLAAHTSNKRQQQNRHAKIRADFNRAVSDSEEPGSGE